MGCIREGKDEAEEGWIWAFGMPIHLWGSWTFEKIGEICGGLLEVGTTESGLTKWVKLKVQKPWRAPSEIWLSDGLLAFKVALWRLELP